ncbi:Panacea domain-containing protein [Vibrio vulnificus]
MAKAVDIAAEMVRYANSVDRDLTHMQLQKLVYIAHGISLAQDHNLLDEEVDAWKYGPVIDPLYQVLKPFGSGKVKLKENFEETGLTAEELSLIKDVVDKFKDYDGIALSTLTHQKGSPWFEVWNNGKGHEIRGAKIPNELIKQHYKKILATGKATAL